MCRRFMMVCLTIIFLCAAVIAQEDDDSRRLEDRYQHPPQMATAARGPFYNYQQDNATFWRVRAQKTLRQLLNKPKNENVAKNVILFLGDGMSIPTITSSRIYTGKAEEFELAFDKFPFTGLSKTYCVDKQVADSACSATAYLTGVKANYQTVGVSSSVDLNDCTANANKDLHTHSIAAWSQLKGKRTGLVTTARITHASPAGVYAHTANRNWEADTDVIDSGRDPKICPDIAYQLVYGETGQKLNVVLGGGRGEFMPKERRDSKGDRGFRSDRRDLVQEWLDQHRKRGRNAKYVNDRSELLAEDGRADHLLGMFDASHVPYNLDRNTTIDPSLEDMVISAIRHLSKGPEGYFLFVEGARIDMAHHEAKTRKSFDEVAEFSKAIQRAVDMTNERDTLIVVTSDHAHSMTFSGYPDRSRDILGLSGLKDDEGYDYLTINYANGPGYRMVNADGTRWNVSAANFRDKDFRYPGAFPLEAETHGGDDVAIFAKGPFAHLFTGVMEQNTIPHVLAYASCVGDGLTACSGMGQARPMPGSSFNWGADPANTFGSGNVAVARPSQGGKPQNGRPNQNGQPNRGGSSNNQGGINPDFGFPRPQTGGNGAPPNPFGWNNNAGPSIETQGFPNPGPSVPARPNPPRPGYLGTWHNRN